MIRVLIVDDDKLARIGLISLLPWERYGMEVVGDVQNGRAALEFLGNQEADLLFVDIDMPEMTGLELIEACRKQYPSLEFVILTFYEDFGYAQNAIRLGVLDYISKLKLDAEDGDAILSRILNMLKRKAELGEGAVFLRQALKGTRIGAGNGGSEPEEEPDPEDWGHLVKRWKQGFWLYDEEAFSELCREAESLGNIVSTMWHFSAWMTQAMEIELGYGKAAERSLEQRKKPDSLSGIWTQLSAWREEMAQFAVREKSLSSMSVCMLKTVQYVKGHLEEPLHTEELAEKVGMSRSYFSVNFKKLTGKTFHEYVKRERLLEAKRLLGEGRAGIIEVASRCGYEDVNYFNKVFLEETGCTPGAYRKQREKEGA